MEVARITAIVTANTTGFLRGMAQVDAGVKRASAQMSGLAATANTVGTRMSSLGATLTKRLSLPALAVGAASVVMATNFETSMAKIQGLVGVGAADVEKLAASAQRIGPAFGVSAGEAADALFFITSAGISAAEAGSVLEASAKASAVGLGDTATVADLATSAMNAYGSSTLPASKATDVMVAAVREGKLETTELAGSMGRVLPVASAMGVSFNEVGASFAALSRTGTNAAEAATQIRGILASILRPTKMAQETLAEYGLSAGDLRKQIREKGLLSVLKSLTTTFGDNEEAQARVFGNIRALSGVMDLMGKNTKKTEQIFADMANVSGDLDAAFAVTSQTTAFKMAQAMEQVKTALLGLGQAIAPVVAGLAGMIAAVGSAFGKLPGPVKTVAGAMLGVAAVIGPLALGVGKLTTMLTGATAATAALGGASARTAVAMTAMNAATMTGGATTFVKLGGAAATSGAAVAGTAGKVGMLSSRLAMMGGPIGLAVASVVGLGATMFSFRNTMSAVERQNASLAESQNRVTEASKAQTTAFQMTGQQVRNISAATNEVKGREDELRVAQTALNNAIKAGNVSSAEMLRLRRDVAVAENELAGAYATQNLTASQSVKTAREAITADDEHTKSLRDQQGVLKGQTTGLAALAAGTEETAKRKSELAVVTAELNIREAEQAGRLTDIRKRLVSQRDALKKSGSQSAETKAQVAGLDTIIGELSKKIKNTKPIKVKAETRAPEAAIARVKKNLEGLDGKSVNVTVNITERLRRAANGDGQYKGGIIGMAAGGTVRGPSGRDVIPAMLTAGEAVLTEKQQSLVNSGMTIGQAFRATGVPGFAKGKGGKKTEKQKEAEERAKARRERVASAGRNLLESMRSDLSGRLSAKFQGGLTGPGGTGFSIGKAEEMRRAQEGNLKSLESSFGMDALQKNIANAMKAFGKTTAGELKAFEKTSASSMATFEKAASDAIDAVNKKFDEQRKSTEAMFDALTPAEQALKAFDDRMQATDIASGISDAQKALEDARSFGSANQIQDAQRALDSALLAQERAGLEDRAEQSRTEADAKREEALSLLAEQQKAELESTQSHHDGLIAKEQERIDTAREALEEDIERRRAIAEEGYAQEVAAKQAQIEAALQTQRDADAAQLAQLQYQQQQEQMALDRRFKRMEGHFNRAGDLGVKKTREMVSKLLWFRNSFENTGTVLLGSLIRGMSKKSPALAAAARAMAKIMQDYLKLNSPAKKGPLSDINHWFDALGPTLASGIDTGAIENELNGMRPSGGRSRGSGSATTINLNVSDQTFAGMSREQADRVAREIQAALDRQVRITI